MNKPTEPEGEADQAVDPSINTASKKNSTVTLAQPIRRGETTIEEIDLRKPKAGELRGLSLQDVIGSDITALLQLLPRISQPPLTSDECDDLDPSDLSEIGGTIRGFFMTQAERKMMNALIAEHQPKT